MKVSFVKAALWRPYYVHLIEELLLRGFVVTIGSFEWSVEVPEYNSLLSAIWVVFARLSRGIGFDPRRHRYFKINDKVFVRYWWDGSGIRSIKMEDVVNG